MLINSHDDVNGDLYIKDRVLISDVEYREMNVRENKSFNMFSFLLVFKLMFNKLNSIVNILNVSLATSVLFIIVKLDDILKNNLKDYKFLIDNIFVKFSYVFNNFKLLALVLFISSICVYIISFIHEFLVNKKQINNLVDYFNYKIVIKHFFIRILVELIIIVILSILSIYLISKELIKIK